MDTSMRQILAVEDSEDAQARILAALGDDYAVRLAPTLADARQQLESAVPDLVLLDVELPDGSGFQLCSELQAASGTREVPVVFLTSHTATGEKVLAFSLGADDYLDKPFDPLELRARVESRLRKRDLRRERAIAYGPFSHRPRPLQGAAGDTRGKRGARRDSARDQAPVRAGLAPRGDREARGSRALPSFGMISVIPVADAQLATCGRPVRFLPKPFTPARLRAFLHGLRNDARLRALELSDAPDVGRAGDRRLRAPRHRRPPDPE
jgi:CheY-like chemotaxis protein